MVWRVDLLGVSVRPVAKYGEWCVRRLLWRDQDSMSWPRPTRTLTTVSWSLSRRQSSVRKWPVEEDSQPDTFGSANAAPIDFIILWGRHSEVVVE